MYLRPRAGLQVAPGDDGQVLPELDAEDTLTLAGEGGRDMARTAADRGYPAPRCYTRRGHHVVKERLRVAGPRLVVQERSLVEGGPRPVALFCTESSLRNEFDPVNEGQARAL